MLYAQIAAIFVIAICMFALIKGDESERFGAGAYVLMWFATVLSQSDKSAYDTNLIMLCLDIAFLGILCVISWRYKRSWPIWAAGLQLVSVISHIFVVFSVTNVSTSLYTVLNLTGYGVLLCIAVGTFWAWQERRAAGIE